MSPAADNLNLEEQKQLMCEYGSLGAALTAAEAHVHALLAAVSHLHRDGQRMPQKHHIYCGEVAACNG